MLENNESSPASAAPNVVPASTPITPVTGKKNRLVGAIQKVAPFLFRGQKKSEALKPVMPVAPIATASLERLPSVQTAFAIRPALAVKKPMIATAKKKSVHPKKKKKTVRHGTKKKTVSRSRKERTLKYIPPVRKPVSQLTVTKTVPNQPASTGGSTHVLYVLPQKKKTTGNAPAVAKPVVPPVLPTAIPQKPQDNKEAGKVTSSIVTQKNSWWSFLTTPLPPLIAKQKDASVLPTVSAFVPGSQASGGGMLQPGVVTPSGVPSPVLTPAQAAGGGTPLPQELIQALEDAKAAPPEEPLKIFGFRVPFGNKSQTAVPSNKIPESATSVLPTGLGNVVAQATPPIGFQPRSASQNTQYDDKKLEGGLKVAPQETVDEKDTSTETETDEGAGQSAVVGITTKTVSKKAVADPSPRGFLGMRLPFAKETPKILPAAGSAASTTSAPIAKVTSAQSTSPSTLAHPSGGKILPITSTPPRTFLGVRIPFTGGAITTPLAAAKPSSAPLGSGALSTISTTQDMAGAQALPSLVPSDQPWAAAPIEKKGRKKKGSGSSFRFSEPQIGVVAEQGASKNAGTEAEKPSLTPASEAKATTEKPRSIFGVRIPFTGTVTPSSVASSPDETTEKQKEKEDSSIASGDLATASAAEIKEEVKEEKGSEVTAEKEKAAAVPATVESAVGAEVIAPQLVYRTFLGINIPFTGKVASPLAPSSSDSKKTSNAGTAALLSTTENKNETAALPSLTVSELSKKEVPADKNLKKGKKSGSPSLASEDAKSVAAAEPSAFSEEKTAEGTEALATPAPLAKEPAVAPTEPVVPATTPSTTPAVSAPLTAPRPRTFLGVHLPFAGKTPPPLSASAPSAPASTKAEGVSIAINAGIQPAGVSTVAAPEVPQTLIASGVPASAFSEVLQGGESAAPKLSKKEAAAAKKQAAAEHRSAVKAEADAKKQAAEEHRAALKAEIAAKKQAVVAERATPSADGKENATSTTAEVPSVIAPSVGSILPAGASGSKILSAITPSVAPSFASRAGGSSLSTDSKATGGILPAAPPTRSTNASSALFAKQAEMWNTLAAETPADVVSPTSIIASGKEMLKGFIHSGEAGKGTGTGAATADAVKEIKKEPGWMSKVMSDPKGALTSAWTTLNKPVSREEILGEGGWMQKIVKGSTDAVKNSKTWSVLNKPVNAEELLHEDGWMAKVVKSPTSVVDKVQDSSTWAFLTQNVSLKQKLRRPAEIQAERFLQKIHTEVDESGYAGSPEQVAKSFGGMNTLTADTKKDFASVSIFMQDYLERYQQLSTTLATSTDPAERKQAMSAIAEIKQKGQQAQTAITRLKKLEEAIKDIRQKKEVKEEMQAEKKMRQEQTVTEAPHVNQEMQHKEKSGLEQFMAALNHMGMGKDRTEFIENMATMLNAGLPLIDALHTLQLEAHSKAMKLLIKKIVDAVENGSPLWRAMEDQSFFSLHAIALVRIGEEAGSLAENMRYLAEQESKDNELKSKVQMAMIYPIIVLSIMFVIVMGLGIFVLPKLIGLLTSLNVKLPFITRMIILFSNVMSQHAVIIVPGSLGGIFFLTVLAKYTSFKVVVQWVMFRIPGIGSLAREATIARFGVILGGLLKAGVPVVDAVQSLVNVTPILAYRHFYERLLDHITVGDSFSKSFASIRGSQKLLPASVQQLVITGEKSGALSTIMLKIADIYDKKASNTAQKLPVILEPMLLLFIGALVGTIAIGIIVPIYSIVGNVGGK